MLRKVTDVKFSRDGLTDATFTHALVKTSMTIVRSDHDNQFHETLRKNHANRLNFQVSLTDVLQPNFDINIQRLSAIFNDITYTTNETIRFYPDTVNAPSLFYECYLNGAVQPIGDSKINTGHGIAFSLITPNRFTEDIAEVIGDTGEEIPEV